MNRFHFIRFFGLLARKALLPLVLVAGLLSSASAATDPTLENYIFMDLKDGRVVIQMRPDLAPQHCARLKTLIRQGFYNGLTFHRVIANFVAQGGDPTGTGSGGTGVKIPAEFTSTPFLRGVVGMARAADINSADSQFFIDLADVTSLNGNYTVWGQVVSGMEYVDNITKGEPPANPDRMFRLQLMSDNPISYYLSVAVDYYGQAGKYFGANNSANGYVALAYYNFFLYLDKESTTAGSGKANLNEFYQNLAYGYYVNYSQAGDMAAAYAWYNYLVSFKKP